MSQISGKLTDVGKGIIGQHITQNSDLNLTQFIFANVPLLDPTTAPDSYDQEIPTTHIVHQTNVTKKAFIDDDTVVYSVVLDSTVGDFDFNWVGLIDESGALVILKYVELQQKRGNEFGQGNNLNRNFALKFTGAAQVTSITVPAESWQYDITSVLLDLDEKISNEATIRENSDDQLSANIEALSLSLFYSNSKDYVVGDRVFASNTVRYICKSVNGPNSSVRNPITQPEYWVSEDVYFFDIDNPIGHIRISGSSTDPGTIHGTWTRLKGKFLVGINESDSNWNELNDQGGAKTHTHGAGTYKADEHSHSVSHEGWGVWQISDELQSPTLPGRLVTGSGKSDKGEDNEELAHALNEIDTSESSELDIVGRSGEESHLPPYIAKYMWQRTA